MRKPTLLIAAAALLGSASAALAAPPSVSVAVGPELQRKAEKTYGVREIQALAADLQAAVTRAAARARALDDSRVELVLTDAKPNHPTFKQMSDTPGLSLSSFGLGGATIEGRVMRPDGSVTPVNYRWYENDIRWARGRATWTDAENTIDQFAHRLARGEQVARR